MKALPDEQEDLPESQDTASQRARRPKIVEVLDEKIDIGSSASAMVDAMKLHKNVQHFPILEYSNEPISHLTNKEVKNALEAVPDILHRDCAVGNELHQTYLDQSAYQATVPERGRLDVSPPINLDSVVVNDGDGIILAVNPASDAPLENAVYTRLNRVDAPELCAVHYVRNDDTGNVLHQFKGHLSLLGVHVFLDAFVRKGSAQFCYQLPRRGRNEPTDNYGRPLKEFWFMFSTCPSERELRILDAIVRACDSLDEEKLVLMSPFDPRLATEVRPFYLSMNALLVLTGNCHVFTRFCYDNRMLALQRIAREQHIGPLNCGFTRNHVIGVDVDTTDDVDLSQFHSVNIGQLRQEGYPEWIQHEGRLIGLLPWHERLLKKQVYGFSRHMVQKHLRAPLQSESPVYGMYIDADSR